MSRLDMTIVPLHLIRDVVKKTDEKVYGRFHQTCQKIHQVCTAKETFIAAEYEWIHIGTDLKVFKVDDSNPNNTIHTELPHDEIIKHTIWAESVTIEMDLTNAVVLSLIELAKSIRLVTIDLMLFNVRIECSPGIFRELCQQIKTKFVYFENPSTFPQFNMFNGVNKLALDIKNYHIPSAELVGIRVSNIYCNCLHVDECAIITFLKQWQEGSREVGYLFLRQSGNFNRDLIVSGLGASVLYEPAFHQFSAVADIEFFPENIYIYAFFAKSDIFKYMTIIIQEEFILAEPTNNPADFLKKFQPNIRLQVAQKLFPAEDLNKLLIEVDANRAV